MYATVPEILSGPSQPLVVDSAPDTCQSSSLTKQLVVDSAPDTCQSSSLTKQLVVDSAPDTCQSSSLTKQLVVDSAPEVAAVVRVVIVLDAGRLFWIVNARLANENEERRPSRPPRPLDRRRAHQLTPETHHNRQKEGQIAGHLTVPTRSIF